MKKTGKTKVGKVLAVGVVAAAAGAAAYTLLGPNGKKNRAKVKKVIVTIKKKVTKGNRDIKKLASAIKKAAKKSPARR